MNWIKLIFVVVGLYLIITNLLDMIRDPVRQNIGIQSVSVAIGGGLVAYGLSYKPVTETVTAVLEAVKGTAKAAANTVSDAAKQATRPN